MSALMTWPQVALVLDAASAAPSPTALGEALRPLLASWSAQGLGVAMASDTARDGAVVHWALQPPNLAPAGDARVGLAQALLVAAGGRVGVFRLSDIAPATAPQPRDDALGVPRLGSHGREVAFLIGPALCRGDAVDLVALRVVLETAADRLQAWRLAAKPPRPLLTERQRDCLAAALRGANSIQIAAQLHLSPKTVDAYLAAAAERLGVSNRIAAVGIAVQRGLIG